MKKLAYAKVAEVQRTVNEFRILKYLEGYDDGAANAPKKHSIDELAANDDDGVSEEEDTDESSSVGSVGDGSGEDIRPTLNEEEAAADQPQATGGSLPPPEVVGISAEKPSVPGVDSLPGASAGMEKAPSSSAATTADASIPPTTNVSEE
jgi:hypothetical protein